MNAIFKLSAAAIMLFSISACAPRHGYYAPYSDSYYYGSGGSYYGRSPGYYGNYDGHHHHYSGKKYDKRHYKNGDRHDDHDRTWGYGNRQSWQGSNQYSNNSYRQAPYYNNSEKAWKKHKHQHTHRGEGWREHDDD